MCIHQFICDGCHEEIIAYRQRKPKFCLACTGFRVHARGKTAIKQCKGCGVRMLNVEYGGRWICDECTEVRERRHNGYANPYSSVTRLLAAANDNTPQIKVCTSCECELPLAEFYSHASGGYGRSAACTDCRNALRGDRSEEYAKRARPDLTEEEMAQRILVKRIRLIERANRKRVTELRSLRWKIARYIEQFRKPWLRPGLTLTESRRIRYEHDLEFQLKDRMKSRMRRKGIGANALNNLRRALYGEAGPKAVSTVEASLGYSMAELKSHLESRFTDGMSWEVFRTGIIHIDHIRPLSTFDLEDVGQVAAAWSLENLRPLWAADNLRRPKDGSDVDWHAAA